MRIFLHGSVVVGGGLAATPVQAASFGEDAVVVWSVSGEEDLSGFGRRIAAAGDVNGDGYADLLASAPEAGSGAEAGRTSLFLGGPDGPATSAMWSVWGGVIGGEHGGEGLAGVGDVDGDGYDDVLVADGNLNLRLSLYRGGAGGLESTPAWTTLSPGTASPDVVLGHDFTGDGRVDLVVGLPDRPWSSAWFGDAGWFTRAAPIVNTNAASHFGRDGAVVGDVNGDGYDDLVLTGTSGLPALHLGRPRGFIEDTAWTPAPTSGAGVAGVGDVNGDGLDDFAHAVTTGSGWGGIALTLGADGGPSNEPAWRLEMVRRAELGDELVGCDVDGDGADELVVHATRSSTVVYYVFHLAAGVAPAVPAWVVRDPEGNGSWMDEGWDPQATCAGDVDGDGDEELLVGDRTWRNDRGKVYLFDFP